LTRPESLQKPAVQGLRRHGIKVVPVDLDGPKTELVKALQGLDVVISAIDAAHLRAQIPLADACKAAGVGRFVPCCFATVAPPKGILGLRDIVSSRPE
jgi:methylmalonyl-CoA mutase cobalamin-binding subunit